ncbi:YceG family protein [Niallia sp. 01092]|uniref:YceG family protein n=1 Tax=unclassified Niallia TaxID=2837522 RepID=UPI003FD2C0D7
MNEKVHTINNQILPLSLDNWYELLNRPIKDRPAYKEDNGNLTFGQVMVKLLGIPVDEDEYYNQIFEWIYQEENSLILLTDETLNRVMDNKYFQAIQKVMNIFQDQNLSINRFIAFLDGENLLLKSSIPSVHRKIREAMNAVFQHFAKVEANGMQNSELRRVLVDMIKWSINHLDPALNNSMINGQMPKFMWYGHAKKSQAYFLMYLQEIGCDLVFVHPNGTDVLEQLSLHEKTAFTHKYPQTKEAESFPTEKRRRTATVAYRASREIESILNHEGSGLYKPWQLRNYLPMSVTLKTTYDELFLLEKEMAMIRPNFEVSNGEVKIPTIFAKVFGVSKNRKEYWDRLHTISSAPHALLIKDFPFTRAVVSDFRFHYRNALGKDGKLDCDLMINAHYWNYGRLPIGLQKGIAHAIRTVCDKPFLQPLLNETEEEAAIFLFSQGLLLPPDILKLLQKFDYSQEVPSMILFKTEQNGVFSREDAAVLLLLNTFGIDIILYNPAGHMDIENYVKEDLFDKHLLEDVVFEMEFKEKSFIKKIFYNGILNKRRGDLR